MSRRIRIMMAVLLLSRLLGSELPEAATAAIPPREKSMATILPNEIFSGKKLWVRLDGMTGMTSLKMKGIGLSAGYNWNVLGLDIRASSVTTDYGSISATPNGSELFDPANLDKVVSSDGTELGRSRAKGDSWSFQLFEPGIAVSGRLFANIVPLLSERARFGLGYGLFSDKANGLAFTGIEYSFEGSIQYQLGPGSPWSIELAGATHAGALTLNGSKGSSARLPVSWVSTSLGLLYWF